MDIAILSINKSIKLCKTFKKFFFPPQNQRIKKKESFKKHEREKDGEKLWRRRERDKKHEIERDREIFQKNSNFLPFGRKIGIHILMFNFFIEFSSLYFSPTFFTTYSKVKTESKWISLQSFFVITLSLLGTINPAILAS